MSSNDKTNKQQLRLCRSDQTLGRHSSNQIKESRHENDDFTKWGMSIAKVQNKHWLQPHCPTSVIYFCISVKFGFSRGNHKSGNVLLSFRMATIFMMPSRYCHDINRLTVMYFSSMENLKGHLLKVLWIFTGEKDMINEKKSSHILLGVQRSKYW